MTGIREYLKEHRIIMDGAMGTYYAELMNGESSFSELANIDNPQLVQKIHQEYISAGANLIRTNTFAISTETLGVTEQEQEAIIRSAVASAKQAVKNVAQEEVFIAADIGPIHENAGCSEEEILDEYKRICDIFLTLDVDAFSFETFSDLYYIVPVVRYIRSKKDIFIMTNFCLNKNGFTKNGLSASKLLRETAKMSEIDACGFNCGIGSGHMSHIMEKLSYPDNKFVACLPNAGYPEQMHNRMVFMDNVEYFTENIVKIAEQGIDIIGACCGTTPAYIRSVSTHISHLQGKKHHSMEKCITSKKVELRKNAFYSKFSEGKKVIAVELDPPYDANYERIIECSQELKKQNIDVITMADSPMGRSRVDSILMSIKLANEVGVPVMPHISCRDKNMIAMRSALLGAYINDVRNLLLVTGDPVPSVSRMSTTGVFDYNSIQLMHFVKEMNEEHFSEEPFYYGGALNPTLGKVDKIIERMNKKIAAGALYFLTQPVFSEDAIARIKEIKERVDTKILCGIMPLISYRNATFIKNEFIGIDVPDEIIARYTPEMSKEEAENTGAAIARELIEKLNPYVDGYYFMLPFNRVSLIEKIKPAYEHTK